MSRSFTIGGTGLIPESEYLRKIEETRVTKDTTDYETYLRQQLADFRPDAPFFESDQARDPSDRGSGVASDQRLNLRYEGTRAGISPDLPDGTFLDHEFTERDSRGTQNLPDFNEARRQRESRGKFVKYANDNDYSVPEAGVNPVQMVSLIRGTQKQFQNRYKNFEESMDNFHNGSVKQRGKTSSVTLVTHDGTIVDLANAKYTHRMDPVNLLSNRVPGIPRYTEADHRVKVSKYGQVRPALDMKANSWNENRANAYLDHKTPIPLNGQMVNRLVAHMILNIEGQRDTKQVAAQGADYSESEVTQIRDGRKSIDPADLMKLIAIGLTSQTQDRTAHEQFFSNPMDVRDHQTKSNVRKALDLGKINHHQAASMIQATRALGPQQQKDLRDLVIDASAKHHLDIDLDVRDPGVNKVKDSLVRKALDTRYLEESKGIKLYANIKPEAVLDRTNAIDYEAYKSNSTVRKNSGKAILSKKNDTSTTEQDVDMSEFAVPGRKEQQDFSHKGYSGRGSTAEFGDMDRAESLGNKSDIKHKKLDQKNFNEQINIHEMLSRILSEAD